MANLPGPYDFHIKAEGPWSETVVWKIANVAVDASDYDINLRIKTLTGTTTVVATGDALGNISWTVPALTVATLTGFVTYDLCAYSGDGTPNWLLAGTLEVTA